MNREQIIRDTAYAIWEAEGRPDGRADEHWRKAEANVVLSSGVPERPRPVKPVAKPAANPAAAPAAPSRDGVAPAAAAAPKKAAAARAPRKPKS